MISIVVILGVGSALGFRIQTDPLSAVAAYGLLIVFALAVSWRSVLVGLLARSPESVQIFGFVLILPLTFASNAFVRASTMPGWLQAWVDVNPVSLLSDAMRGLLVGGPVASPALQTLAWAAGIVLVFAPIAVHVYRRRA